MGDEKTGDVELGKKINDALVRSAVSRSDVAAALGVSRQQVGHYINGRSMPPLDVVRTIARECGLTTSQLLGETEPVHDARMTPLLALAPRLDDEDISALTTLARRLASPERVELPEEVEADAASLTEGQRRALGRGIDHSYRLDRLVAEGDPGYDAGDPPERARSSGGRRRGSAGAGDASGVGERR